MTQIIRLKIREGNRRGKKKNRERRKGEVSVCSETHKVDRAESNPQGQHRGSLLSELRKGRSLQVSACRRGAGFSFGEVPALRPQGRMTASLCSERGNTVVVPLLDATLLTGGEKEEGAWASL